jgi:hypothetical protein
MFVYKNQECPPIIIRMIFRFSTKNLTTCQGKNFRQNLVEPVGYGGRLIALGPGVMCFSCILKGIKIKKS